MKSSAYHPVSRLLLISLALGLWGCSFGSQDPAPIAVYGTRPGAGSAGIHTVVAGDTLWSISNRYNLPMRDIAVANGLRAPFELPPGLRLRLPPPQEYRVRADDTLYSVSRLFGVNMSEIASLNGMHEPYTLQGGQVLRIPTMTRKTMPAPPQLAQAQPPVHIAPMPEQKTPPMARPGGPAPVQAQTQAPAQTPTQVASAQPAPRPATREKITAATPKRSSSRFLTPVEGPVISSYGPKPGGLHNDGINIRAPRGAPVRAAENGVVVYAGNELKGSGNLVLVRHEGRWMTAYAHMDNILIRRGDVIRRGQTIGTVGSTGSVDSPQLHFEVRRGTDAVNPRQYIEG